MEGQTLRFDPQKALDTAIAIARPRLVGTGEEIKVGQQLSEKLKSFGFKVQREPFKFADACSTFFILEIVVCQFLVAATIFLSIHPLKYWDETVTAVLGLVFLGLTGGINRAVQGSSLTREGPQPGSLWYRMCQRMGRKFESANYVARWPDVPADNEDIHLTLVAHYDSKSQRMPLANRMVLIALGIGGSVVFSVLILLSTIFPFLTLPALVIGGVAVIAGVPLWFIGLKNESTGAIDNASGVGLVMQLTEALSSHPEICQRLNLAVLLTGAEEVYTMGAVAYVHKHGKQLLEQSKSGKVYILNFDGIGVNGDLRWVGKSYPHSNIDDPCLLCLVRHACIENGCEIKLFNLPGALYDHVPFASIGLDAGTMVSVNRNSLAVHTRRDTPDFLDISGFERAGLVTLQVIESLLDQSGVDQPVPDIGIEKQDIYKHDPVLYFLREKIKFTPLTILLAAFGLGIADLLISKGYDLWLSKGDIVGASVDPPYLLTIFVIMPLFLRTYIWLPDGMFDLFQSLPKNKLIRHRDLSTYQFNVRVLVERYSPSWAKVTLIIAIILQLLVIVLNRFENYQAYNNIDTARLWMIRIPYGLLALYAATFVVIRSILNMDWGEIFKDVEPQIHPLHPDKTGGYGMFTQYITNLLGIFMAIATFFFTKLFFQRDASSAVELRFYPSLFILGSTVLYLLVGFIVFIYIPSRVARRAIVEAKTQHCEKLSEQHCIEQKKLVEMTRKTGSDPQELQAIKNQMEKVKLLRETSEMIKDIPTTPISLRAIPRLGASYILFLIAMLYNLLAYLQQNGVIQNTPLRNAIDFILQLFPK